LQKTLIEAPMFDPATLPADVAILDVDLRRLREARKLLMGRLRRDDAGRCLIKAAQSHRVPTGIDRVKLHEARPGFVEDQVVAERTDARQNVLRIVDRSVISTLLDHRRAERPFAPPRIGILYERILSDCFANGVLFERFRMNRPNQAMSVAIGGKVDRDSAR